MGRANFLPTGSVRKRLTLNKIHLFQFWKLSHPLRQCSIRVQNESNEAVWGTTLATKTGVRPAVTAVVQVQL